jgi:hypothetical protein
MAVLSSAALSTLKSSHSRAGGEILNPIKVCGERGFHRAPEIISHVVMDVYDCQFPAMDRQETTADHTRLNLSLRLSRLWKPNRY